MPGLVIAKLQRSWVFTEGTVRARIKRMEDDGQIRITAINNISRLDNPTLAYIWVEVEKSSQAQLGC